MTELLCLHGRERVLEIGTGSGYQAAVLSRLAETVFTVERIKSLSDSARNSFLSMGIRNVVFRTSDGTLGWEEEAPFDGIIVTAGSPDVPECYFKQLTDGGRLVIPVGNEYSQTLYRFRKKGENINRERTAANHG